MINYDLIKPQDRIFVQHVANYLASLNLNLNLQLGGEVLTGNWRYEYIALWVEGTSEKIIDEGLSGLLSNFPNESPIRGVDYFKEEFPVRSTTSDIAKYHVNITPIGKPTIYVYFKNPSWL